MAANRDNVPGSDTEDNMTLKGRARVIGDTLNTFVEHVSQSHEQARELALEQAGAHVLASAVLVADVCLTDMAARLSEKLGPVIAAKALYRVLGDHAYEHLVRLVRTNYPSISWPTTAEAASGQITRAGLH